MLLFAIASFLLLYVIAVLLLLRLAPLHDEVVRKLIHVGTGTVLFSASFHLIQMEFLILIALVVVAAYFSRFLKPFKRLHKIDRVSYGDTLLPLGIGISAILLFPVSLLALQFGILVTTFSDTAAALIGRKHGTHLFCVYGVRKSIEGSLSFFLVTLIIGTTMFGFGGEIIVVALTLTIVEIYANYGFDNLTLPIAASYLGLLLLV